MKVGIETPLKINAYAVIQRAVEEGVAYGWMRGWKHSDREPDKDKDRLITEIEQAVMNALCEVLIFSEE